MRIETISVDGKPVGKQRPRFAGHAYTPKPTRDYEARIRAAWGNRPMFGGEVSVNIQEYIQVPASYSKKKRMELVGRFANRKPDADNAAKIWMDALNGLAYRDDVDVVQLTVVKVWAEEPMVIAVIKEVREIDQQGTVKAVQAEEGDFPFGGRD